MSAALDQENEDVSYQIKSDLSDQPQSTPYKMVLWRRPDFSELIKQQGYLMNSGQNEVYKVRNYDRLRMKLLRDDQDFYISYKETMKNFCKFYRKNKGKGYYPFFKKIGVTLTKYIGYVLGLYIFWIICLLLIFNPMIIIICSYLAYKWIRSLQIWAKDTQNNFFMK